MRPHTSPAITNGAPRLQPVRPHTSAAISNGPSIKWFDSGIPVSPPGVLALLNGLEDGRTKLGTLSRFLLFLSCIKLVLLILKYCIDRFDMFYKLRNSQVFFWPGLRLCQARDVNLDAGGQKA